MRRKLLASAPLLLILLSGCAGDRPAYDPGVTAADFVQGVTHPFFPLKAGSSWRYESRLADQAETIDVVVMAGTRSIHGVEATMVRDTVRIDGEIAEDTYDWYAQDQEGNVWYVGEDTKEYEDGEVASTAGSWEWGVDGALPGIILKADPQPDGKPYFQEF